MKITSRVIVMAILALPVLSHAAILRVAAGGSGNGSSWSAALGTIDTAMNQANLGDEIWVAERLKGSGTIDYYYESSLQTLAGIGEVLVKDGVSIYGGFNGTETSRDQRDFKTHITKLMLQMRIPMLSDKPTVIDGFTFINTGDAVIFIGDVGSTGTCQQLTLSHNKFNNSGFSVGAIYAYQAPFTCHVTVYGNTFSAGSQPITIPSGAPKILNNLFSEGEIFNSQDVIGIGQGGASAAGAVIANNILWGMSINIQSSGVLVANNTVLGSPSGSLQKLGIAAFGGVTVVNNIVGFYGRGIVGDNLITANHNLVYGNQTNYDGYTPGAGDIQSDPLLIDRAHGDFHLNANSPAINAGDNSVLQAGWTDLDGNPRLLPAGGKVDMGADEFGSAAGGSSKILRVKYGGSGDGSSWSSAFGYIDIAMNAASPGDEIWVAAMPSGSSPDFHYQCSGNPYANCIVTVKDGVSLFGGFNGTETTRDQRNPKTHVTKVDERWNLPMVEDKPTVIDGFYFISGQDIPIYIGADGNHGTCQQLTISNNSFLAQGYSPASIMTSVLFHCSLTLQGNAFLPGSAIVLISGGTPKILNNSFSAGGIPTGTAFQLGELGVNNQDSTGAVIANNVVWGMKVSILNSGVLVANNTVVSWNTNSPFSFVSGIYLSGGSTVVNNIVAFYQNGTGIQANAPITEHHNIVFGNATNYGNGNNSLSLDPSDKIVDPALVASTSGDLHLTAGSPALNAGDNSVVRAGWTDVDGNARVFPLGGQVDIGAYEYGATSSNLPPQIVTTAANPNPVSGHVSTLNVSATDPDGDSLSYFWSTVGSPPAAIAFSAQNAATTDITFQKAGSYTFQVTVNDGHNHTVVSGPIPVSVTPVVSGIGVNPSQTTVLFSHTQTLTAFVKDQFGDSMGPADPATTWVLAPAGTDSSMSLASGASTVFTAGITPHNYTVTAQSGPSQGQALISVAAVLPVLTSMSPNAASQDDPSFTLTISGDHFQNPPPTVRWNSHDRTTHFISSTQLSADIPASDISLPGIAAVTLAGAAGSLPFDVVEIPGMPDLGGLTNQAVLPLSGTVQVHASGNPAQYVFLFTPFNSNAASARSSARAQSATSGYNAASPSGALALNSVAGLVPGSYHLSVTAQNRLGKSSAQATVDVTLVISGLGSARVYPNPWRSDLHAGHDVTFDQLTVNSSIKIFTVSGHLVRVLPTTNDSVLWNLTNDSGDKVASGIYLYLITAGDGQKKTGQITVIK